MTTDQQTLGPVVGSLLAKLLDETGLWGPEMTMRDGSGQRILTTADEWIEASRIPALMLRDWLLDICRDHGLDKDALQMTPTQLRGLGFPVALGAGDDDDD